MGLPEGGAGNFEMKQTGFLLRRRQWMGGWMDGWMDEWTNGRQRDMHAGSTIHEIHIPSQTQGKKDSAVYEQL